MTDPNKGESEKPAEGQNAPDKAKKPTVPKLPPGTKIGKGGGGIRTNVQVPILQENTTLRDGPPTEKKHTESAIEGDS